MLTPRRFASLTILLAATLGSTRAFAASARVMPTFAPTTGGATAGVVGAF